MFSHMTLYHRPPTTGVCFTDLFRTLKKTKEALFEKVLFAPGTGEVKRFCWWNGASGLVSDPLISCVFLSFLLLPVGFSLRLRGRGGGGGEKLFSCILNRSDQDQSLRFLMLRRLAGTGSASLFAVITVIYDHLRFVGCDFKMRAVFFLPDSLASSYRSHRSHRWFQELSRLERHCSDFLSNTFK